MSISAKRIAQRARAALEHEASLSPKPGLVDAENNGAHTDMDLKLLFKSAAALEPYFMELAAAGEREAALPPEGRLKSIRPIGLDAERAMVAATNGVNTHKGAVFLLGILCYCAGRTASKSDVSPEKLCREAALVCDGVTGELGGQAGRAFAQYGARGARGEAEDGYPNVLNALSTFRKALVNGVNEEDGWRLALLGLIYQVEDANVLARCGEQTAAFLRARAGEIAARYPAGGSGLAEAMRDFDRQCRSWRASPGGSADLLACAMFLHSLATN